MGGRGAPGVKSNIEDVEYCGIKGKFCAKTLIICKGLATKLTVDLTSDPRHANPNRSLVESISSWTSHFIIECKQEKDLVSNSTLSKANVAANRCCRLVATGLRKVLSVAKDRYSHFNNIVTVCCKGSVTRLGRERARAISGHIYPYLSELRRDFFG